MVRETDKDACQYRSESEILEAKGKPSYVTHQAERAFYHYKGDDTVYLVPIRNYVNPRQEQIVVRQRHDPDFCSTWPTWFDVMERDCSEGCCCWTCPCDVLSQQCIVDESDSESNRSYNSDDSDESETDEEDGDDTENDDDGDGDGYYRGRDGDDSEDEDEEEEYGEEEEEYWEEEEDEDEKEEEDIDEEYDSERGYQSGRNKKFVIDEGGKNFQPCRNCNYCWRGRYGPYPIGDPDSDYE